MESSCKVSIVLPTYNGAKRLRQSIESCLSQTYRNIELIVVDDGSSDSTPPIVRSYTDPRIQYVRHPKNRGLPRALNTGFARTTGEYLTWTSDDNRFLPSAIEELLNCLRQNPQVDFVYADYHAHYERTGETCLRKLPDRLNLAGENGVGACFLYTRRVYERVGGYDPRQPLVEDYDYWIRIANEFNVRHYAKPLYVYTEHSASLKSTRHHSIALADSVLKYRNGYVPLGRVLQSMVRFSLAIPFERSPKRVMHACLGTASRLFRVSPALGAAFMPLFVGLVSARGAAWAGRKLRDLKWRLSGRTRACADHVVSTRSPGAGPRAKAARILIYSDMCAAPWGGSEVLWSRLIPVLQQRDATVAVTCFASDRSRQVCAQNEITEALLLPPSIVAPPTREAMPVLAQMRTCCARYVSRRSWLRQQWQFCDRFSPDVVFVSMAWPGAGGPLHRFLRQARVPYVCFLHSIDKSYAQCSADEERRAFFAGASRVLTTGQTSTRMLEQWLGRPLETAVPMLNFVDTDLFTPRTSDTDPRESNVTHLLSIARLSVREKGQDILLQSLAELLDLNWRMTFAGDGPDRTLLEKGAQRLGLEERVSFLGDVPTPRVRELLSSHDVFILSSHFEGMPLSLLEAMASGLACVTTNVGSINELICDGETGLLVEPESVVGLGKAIRRMIEDPALRHRCATQASVVVREKCDSTRFLQRVADMVQALRPTALAVQGGRPQSGRR